MVDGDSSSSDPLSVDALVQEVARLRRKIFDLEQENDLLALENERLRALPSVPGALPPGPSAAEGGAGETNIFGSRDEISYLQTATDEESRFAKDEYMVIEGAGNGLNPLCCRVGSVAGVKVGLVGGVDKMLSAYSLDDDEERQPSQAGSGGVDEAKQQQQEQPQGKKRLLGSTAGFEVGGWVMMMMMMMMMMVVVVVVMIVEPKAPILSLDVRPSVGDDDGSMLVVLVTCMDGSHALVEVAVAEGGGGEERPVVIKMDIVHRAKDHQKYVVVGRWSPDGSRYATGGHDKSARLYAYKPSGGEKRSEMIRELFFSGNVEALTFVTPVDSSTGEPWLILSTRGLPHLTYLSCHGFDRKDVSLNASDWDTHVSFTVLSLAASPCGRYLLAATDKSRLIVYRMGTNHILRNLYGHNGDEYSNPRAIWHPTGKYISCSSQQPHQVVTWCVSSERVVSNLMGHSSTIRDLHCDAGTGLMASVAYDKTLRVYHYAG